MGRFYKGELISLGEVSKRWNCGSNTVATTLIEIASIHKDKMDLFTFYNVDKKRQDAALSTIYEISECIWDEVGKVWIDMDTNKPILYENIHVETETIKIAEKDREYLRLYISTSAIKDFIYDKPCEDDNKDNPIIKNLADQLYQEQNKNMELNERIKHLETENELLHKEIKLKEPKSPVKAALWEQSVKTVLQVVIDTYTTELGEKEKWKHEDFIKACKDNFRDCLTKVINAAWEKLSEDYKLKGGRPRKNP